MRRMDPVESVNPDLRLWPELRLLRVFGALLIAAFPLAGAMAVSAVIGGADLTSGSDLFALTFAYPAALIWMGICTCLHLGLARILGQVTRRQCFIWGMTTAVVLGLAVLALAFVSPEGDIRPAAGGNWRGTLEGMAMIFAPFLAAGWLSGPIYWRLGMPSPDPTLLLTKRSHKFLGAILAALSTVVPTMIAVLTKPDAGTARRLFDIGLVSLLLWWIGGAVCARLRGLIRLRECLALGALFGLLLPVASIFLSALLDQWLQPTGRSFSAIFGNSELLRDLAAVGFAGLPFGLLGGWVYHRLGAQPSITGLEQSALEHSVTPLQRSWRDLGKLRLAGALLAASLPWILAGAVGASIGRSERPNGFTISELSSALVVLELWYLVLGFTYLFGVSRRRGRIDRRDCLWLGTLLTCLFAVFIASVGPLFTPDGSWTGLGLGSFFSNLLGAIVLGIVIVPAGLLSGWIFWRVGVRPAKTSELDSVAVFE